MPLPGEISMVQRIFAEGLREGLQKTAKKNFTSTAQV
jgi:hypothetical protein